MRQHFGHHLVILYMEEIDRGMYKDCIVEGPSNTIIGYFVQSKRNIHQSETCKRAKARAAVDVKINTRITASNNLEVFVLKNS